MNRESDQNDMKLEALLHCQNLKLGLAVIPAQAGIQCRDLDSRLRGNDVAPKRTVHRALVPMPQRPIIPKQGFPGTIR
jgi:hypothetical protein